MRIISKFRDYYDFGMMYGQDPKAVYVRNLRQEYLAQLPELERLSPVKIMFENQDRADDVVWIVYAIIGGKVRKFYLEYGGRSAGYKESVADIYRITHSQDEAFGGRVESYMSTVRRATSPAEIDNGDDRFSEFAKVNKAPVIIVGMANAPALMEGVNPHWMETPDFDFDYRHVVFNPACLGTLKFGEVIPATEMFDTISNFVLSINDMPMVELGNPEKIVKAGFDLKKSFRHRK